MKLRTVMNDLGNAEKVRSLTEYPESITKFHTLMSLPENAAKFKTVTSQAENTTKFRTIMSRSESAAGSQSGVNPMSGANPMLAVASRISESGGYPSNSGYSEILPGITRFRTRRGAPGSITEIRMISGIRPAVLQILKTDAALLIHRQIGYPVTLLLQIFHRLQNCRMFNRCRNQMLSPAAVCMCCSNQGKIIGLCTS